MSKFQFLSIFDKQKIYLLLFLVGISIIFLLIGTKSSPLYATNDWTDANASFTMGKSMMHGKILYKDIFNQKGPLIYTMHGIAYLLSNKSFIGVFYFEVLFFTIFLFFSFKLFRIYLSKKHSLLGVPVISFLIINNESFSHGDSPEQFCVTFLMISLYYLIKHLNSKYNNPMDPKVIILNGFIAGCVLWMKYSLLGFWIGWILVITIVSIKKKNYKNIIYLNLYFILGIMFATIPFIIYFGANNALYEWFDSYFLVNLDQYSQHSTFWKKFIFIIKKSGSGLKRDILFAIISLFGIFMVLFSNFYFKNIWKKVYLLLPFVLLVITIYSGGRSYIYYFLLISPISIFGIINLMKLLKNKWLNQFIDTKKSYVHTSILTFILLIYTLLFNHNTDMIWVDKSNLIQFSFAKIINKSPNPTLLNYGSLDVGLFTTTGIIPNIKFYQKQNIEYHRFPINMDEQNRYLEEQLVEFVVTKEFADKEYESIYQRENIDKSKLLGHLYELIDEKHQNFQGKMRIFKLYKLKNR